MRSVGGVLGIEDRDAIRRLAPAERVALALALEELDPGGIPQKPPAPSRTGSALVPGLA